MEPAALVFTKDQELLWKIPVARWGSEGYQPLPVANCPRFVEDGTRTSCASSSGSSFCGGFYGGTPGYVYCQWGLYEDG